MGVQEALADGVGVFGGVGVAVGGAVVSGPPADGAFDGTAADGSEEDAEGNGGGVGCVGP